MGRSLFYNYPEAQLVAENGKDAQINMMSNAGWNDFAKIV
jgi:hypothetical protein